MGCLDVRMYLIYRQDYCRLINEWNLHTLYTAWHMAKHVCSKPPCGLYCTMGCHGMQHDTI